MSGERVGISVIIPVATGDTAWQGLLSDLVSLSAEDEIIFSSKISVHSDLRKVADENGISCPCFWVKSEQGRGRQLNRGARGACNDFLWFLHGDSKVSEEAIIKLKKSIQMDAEGIHFFNLRFLQDGPRWTMANAFGAWIRSRILRLPFGDQGYCLSKKTFEHLGGFCENSAYGEDHLLIWKAHQKKIKLRCVGASIETSARRYQTHGWAKTTGRHLVLTLRQAAPELVRLLNLRAAKNQDQKRGPVS